MIVDTSVWIAYLSTSESLASRWLADRIAADSTVIVPEVVMMELLIGKTDEDTAALASWRLRPYSRQQRVGGHHNRDCGRDSEYAHPHPDIDWRGVEHHIHRG